MFFSILKWVIISLTLIFLVHHLYMFLLNTLTVPKIKDLVNKPNQQYKDIFETLHTIKPDTKPTSTTHAIPEQIADELTSFLSDLKKTTVGANGMANGVGPNNIGANGSANGVANGVANGMANGVGPKNAPIIGTSDIDSLGYSLF